MTKEEYDSYLVEDRLIFSARMSIAPIEDCALMDEAAQEIIKLRKWRNLVDTVLTDNQLDFIHTDGLSIRQRLMNE